MIPTTSSPSSSLTRIGVEFSINSLRYFASSNVCSGARADFPGGGVVFLLTLSFLLQLPFGGDGDMVLRGTTTPALDLPIITGARRNPQIRLRHAHRQFVEAVLAQRHIPRIIPQQVLRAQFGDRS